MLSFIVYFLCLNLLKEVWRGTSSRVAGELRLYNEVTKLAVTWDPSENFYSAFIKQIAGFDNKFGPKDKKACLPPPPSPEV